MLTSSNHKSILHYPSQQAIGALAVAWLTKKGLAVGISTLLMLESKLDMVREWRLAWTWTCKQDRQFVKLSWALFQNYPRPGPKLEKRWQIYISPNCKSSQLWWLLDWLNILSFLMMESKLETITDEHEHVSMKHTINKTNIADISH